MYLSFNNLKLITKYFLISILLILAQAYCPQIWITQNFNINIDLLLIFLTFLCLLKNDIYIIIIYAFLIGLLQDFVINVGIIGSLSFLKSLVAYSIGLLNKRNRLWNKSIKILYLYFIYFCHFFIYYYILMNNNFILIFSLSIVQSLVSLMLFYIIEKIFYKSKLI